MHNLRLVNCQLGDVVQLVATRRFDVSEEDRCFARTWILGRWGYYFLYTTQGRCIAEDLFIIIKWLLLIVKRLQSITVISTCLTFSAKHVILKLFAPKIKTFNSIRFSFELGREGRELGREYGGTSLGFKWKAISDETFFNFVEGV